PPPPASSPSPEAPPPAPEPPSGYSPLPQAAQASYGQEWSGFARPQQKSRKTLVITDSSTWKKQWRRLSDLRVPDVDFTKLMVVGIVAGQNDRADNLAIEDVGNDLSGMVVQYRLVVQRRMLELMGAQRAAKRTLVPYVLRAIVKTSTPIHFHLAGGE